MKLAVNPNRMELMKLKKRLAFAVRCNKLLKDKQEELMRQFMILVKETRKIRETVEEQLADAFRTFLSARFDMQLEHLEDALSFPDEKVQIEVSRVPVMNLRVPKFEYRWDRKTFSYGFSHTSGDLDISLSSFSDLLHEMIRMAENEKSVQLVAEELEKTRRRVNALEHKLIPSLKETIKFITNKLNEMERSNLSRLMKIKDIVRK